MKKGDDLVTFSKAIIMELYKVTPFFHKFCKIFHHEPSPTLISVIVGSRLVISQNEIAYVE